MQQALGSRSGDGWELTRAGGSGSGSCCAADRVSSEITEFLSAFFSGLHFSICSCPWKNFCVLKQAVYSNEN